MKKLEPKIRNRLRLNNAIALLSWCLNLMLILSGAPGWSILLVGVLGGYFLLRDWRLYSSLARESIFPPHRDPDVQALIDGDIDITEYRQRKEIAVPHEARVPAGDASSNR